MKEQAKGERRGSRSVGWIIIILSFALGGYLMVGDAARLQKIQIAYLEGLQTRLRSETVPLKFMVESRGGGEIKAKIKLYDLSGREISSMEKSWPGGELYIDMLLFPVRGEAAGKAADSYLAFPYRVFTDKVSAASGSLLFDSYDSGGFPEVLSGISWSAKEEAAIKSAFASARKKAAAGLPAAGELPGSFGSAVHEVSKLSRLEEGVVYKVVCRVKGGVEILED
jgi:hypothetical protein